MARRFGGKFSTIAQGASLPPAPKAPRAPRLLYVPGVILVAGAINAPALDLVLALAGGAVLTLAAYLLAEGITAQAAYEARKIARRPALPRKILANLLTGLGAALAASVAGSDLVSAALYALAAMALHLAAFGIDPLADKTPAGLDTFQRDRVARVVTEAEAHLAAITAQIATISDRRLQASVADFAQRARQMIAIVEDDPRDLTSARKFLGIYLMGARDATVKFVDLYRRGNAADLREKYVALLADLDQNFAQRSAQLLQDDHSDMDIEINVLRDRLQRDGISIT